MGRKITARIAHAVEHLRFGHFLPVFKIIARQPKAHALASAPLVNLCLPDESTAEATVNEIVFTAYRIHEVCSNTAWYLGNQSADNWLCSQFSNRIAEEFEASPMDVFD